MKFVLRTAILSFLFSFSLFSQTKIDLLQSRLITHMQKGAYAEALKDMEETALYIRTHPDDIPDAKRTLAALYLKASEISLRLHHRETALWWLEKLAEIPDQDIDANKRAMLAKIFAFSAQQEFMRGDASRAVRLALKAYSLHKRIYGSKNETVALLSNLIGAAYLKTDRYEASLEWSRRAYDYFRTHEMAPESVKSAMNIGTALMRTGRYEEALSFQEEALRFAKDRMSQQYALLASLYNTIGIGYLKAQMPKRAYEAFEAAMKLHKERKGVSFVKSALGLFRFHLHMHDLSEAKRYLDTAQRAYEKTARREAEVAVSIEKGYADYYIETNDLERARTHVKKALKASPEKGLLRAYVYATLADIDADTGAYAEAVEHLQKSLTIKKRLLGSSHPDLAYTYLKLSNLLADAGARARSESYVVEALKLLQRYREKIEPLYIWAYGNLASLYLQQERAEEAYRAATEATKHFFDYMYRYDGVSDKRQKFGMKYYYRGIFELLSRSVFAYVKRDKTQKSALAYERLFIAWSRYKRLVNGSLDRMALLYRKANDEERKMIDAFKEARKRFDLYLQEKREDSSRLLYLQTRLHRYALRVSALMERYGLSLRKPPDRLDPFLEHLSRNAAYIDFARIGENYLRFILTKENGLEVRLYDANETKSVEEIVAKIAYEREKIVAGESFADIRRAKRLYAKLYRALFPDGRPEKESLFISPDGGLVFVPFEALYDDSESVYLVQKHTVIYFASAQALLQKKSAYGAGVNVVIFDNPDYRDTNGSYAPLYGTKREADAIERHIGRVVRFSRTEATRSRLLQVKHPSLLHIAAHGYIEEEMNRSGLASVGIVLAKGERVSGLSLAGIALSGTQLVTLSSCQSALGRVSYAEGVSGLYEAFFQAGAQRVAMNLWQVNDAVSAKVTDYFYAAISSKTGYAEALREMKRKLIGEGVSHPYYWAGMIMYARSAE